MNKFQRILASGAKRNKFSRKPESLCFCFPLILDHGHCCLARTVWLTVPTCPLSIIQLPYRATKTTRRPAPGQYIRCYHKLIYVDRPAKHSPPLTKLTNLSSEWKVGVVLKIKENVYRQLIILRLQYFKNLLNLSLFMKFVL